MKVQMQALVETKWLLEEEQRPSQLEYSIAVIDSLREEGEPELQFCPFPVVTQKMKSQQSIVQGSQPAGASLMTEFTTYHPYTWAKLVELGKILTED